MALTKQQKQFRIDRLRGELESANTLIVTGFSGLTVAQDLELRRRLRQAGGRFRVIKNTLAGRAAQNTAAASALAKLKGVSAIVYTQGDGVALAKALQDYVKDNPALTVKAGVVDGNAISAAEVVQLASIPSREELYAKLLFLIQAPAQRLVTVVNAVGRSTAVVIDQAVKANKFSE